MCSLILAEESGELGSEYYKYGSNNADFISGHDYGDGLIEERTNHLLLEQNLPMKVLRVMLQQEQFL